jgi:hypothetical protein
MQNYKLLDGINIQWPWSELLVSGKKVIETRSYPLPERLKGVELAVIETPGPKGKREAGIAKARIIGTIIFDGSYQYKSRSHWLREKAKHLVTPDDKQFKYLLNKKKYAWTVGQVNRFSSPLPPPSKRGIVIAKNCKVPKG